MTTWTSSADYEQIKAAVTYSGGEEGKWLTFGPIGDHPLSGKLFPPYDHEGMVKDLEELRHILEYATSAMVFDIKQLLQETLNEWKEDKARLKRVILGCFPDYEQERIEKIFHDRYLIDISAGDLFGEKCPLLSGGAFEFGIRPVKGIVNTQDLAHMTAEGLILGQMSSWYRSRENRIMDVVVRNHPLFLERCPSIIALDDGQYLSGGDIVNIDENHMAIGIRSFTDRESAIEISKRLPDKRIYAVLKFPQELGSTWVAHYGKHLDYMFTMLDKERAMIQPYIFDYPKGSRKTLLKMLQTLSDDLYKWEPVREESDFQKDRWAEIPDRLKPRIESRVYGGLSRERVNALKDVGSVEIYENGKLVEQNPSFVDSLVDEGLLDPDEIILVGGDPNNIDYRNEYEHWLTSVREGAWACSAAVLKPNTVLAYHDMERTNENLRYHGVDTYEIDGRFVKLIHRTGLSNFILPLWRA